MVTDPIGKSGIEEAVFEIALVAERVLGTRKPTDLFHAVTVLLAERSGCSADKLNKPNNSGFATMSALTRIERNVVDLVAEGLTNKEIGNQLFVSHRTIDSHVSHSLAKLGLTSRVQLARLVVQQEKQQAS